MTYQQWLHQWLHLGGDMPDDADLLPAEDRCARAMCGGLPRAAHVGWENGGPSHAFEEPARLPRADRQASCHIQTDWSCTHCGGENNVWGVAGGEWMECAECGKDSFLVPFMDTQIGGARVAG